MSDKNRTSSHFYSKAQTRTSSKQIVNDYTHDSIMMSTSGYPSKLAFKPKINFGRNTSMGTTVTPKLNLKNLPNSLHQDNVDLRESLAQSENNTNRTLNESGSTQKRNGAGARRHSIETGGNQHINYLENLELKEQSNRKSSAFVKKSSHAPFKQSHGRNSDFTEQIILAENPLNSFRSRQMQETERQQSSISELNMHSSNKHITHREEQIHRDESRPFLKDPSWPRTDFSPNLGSFKNRKASPISKVQKMHQALVDAQ